MRIAHVTDFYLPRLGGIEMHVHDLATRQQAAGHRVEVITSTPRPAAQRRAVEPADGLRVRRLTEDVRLPAVAHPSLVRAGRRALRTGKFDVVHVHIGLVSPLGLVAAALAAETPTVVTLHSLISHWSPAFEVARGLMRSKSWPAVWTAVSDVAAEQLRRHVGPAPVHVLPNGIDAAAWRTDPLPRDPDEVLIVAVMRLAPRKRPMHLLRMLRRARAMLPSSIRLRAVIVGEGPERRSADRYLGRHGMADWVTMPGRLSRPQIHSMFARADMFVAPAILESFGIAALEARSAGLPVVARAEGGVGEFVIDGEEGILADSDSAMVDAIVRLAADPAARAAMAARNRAAEPPVAWPDVQRRTMEMYELAAERIRPARSRDVLAG